MRERRYDHLALVNRLAAEIAAVNNFYGTLATNAPINPTEPINPDNPE